MTVLQCVLGRWRRFRSPSLRLLQGFGSPPAHPVPPAGLASLVLRGCHHPHPPFTDLITALTAAETAIASVRAITGRPDPEVRAALTAFVQSRPGTMAAEAPRFVASVVNTGRLPRASA